jgi:hypothetical protein
MFCFLNFSLFAFVKSKTIRKGYYYKRIIVKLFNLAPVFVIPPRFPPHHVLYFPQFFIWGFP